ncbi:EAL domain-containing protein [Faecalicatena contorta]|uniref:Diguanylate cyclase (GGDEF) domain-containing protein n=1 Tax=Faecalicatena contorta TaxID=39482 RepID=A0A316A566_9FIRM|nr:EAL domain-containing protein [Faecalicatena contorta]PWJ52338.1 diguanylate cyclase/phosphodiesterase [Faecalicatena contorta]SUQ12616.1 diguanylate cyclase (GGDEF) domain-containing protein [Faecalicatena contorta]
MRKQKAQPILNRILIPMVLLTLMEVLLLSGTFIFGGAIQELNDNAKGIVQGKVINRASYLQNEMINSWSNMSHTLQFINQRAEELNKNGTIDLNRIDENSDACYPLLSDISDNLIDMLRANKVTGVFVAFNTDNPEELRTQDSFRKPGVYFRDLDPETSPSIRNSDLLIERGPVELVHNLDISTDRCWKPQFEFHADSPGVYDLLLNPQEQSYKNPNASSLSQLGYWSPPHVLKGDDKLMISYTLPLITSKGQTYGVIGMEITLDYISTLLPAEELMDNKAACYLLVTKKADNDDYQIIFSSDNSVVSAVRPFDVQRAEDGTLYFQSEDKEKYFLDIEYLQLYDSNGPFESEQWGLAGAVKQKDITEFSTHILSYIAIAIFLTIIIGVSGSALVSFMITRPIHLVSKNMQKLDTHKKLHLPRTNIYEFDQMEISIEKLSRDVIDSATKFTQILNKASIRIAGFEMNLATGTLFITDGFFDIFGENKVSTHSLDIHSFQQQLKAFDIYKKEESDGYTLYKVPYGERHSYIKLSYSVLEDKRVIGVVEDITKTIQEKQLIEHERDHDLLTGLKNRRAFLRIMPQLFKKGKEHLKKAALVMIDLDNLKYINDKYGHDYGDKYIQTAAECFRKYTPPDTIIARISGDEFHLFFYGYDTEEEINQALNRLREGIDSEFILLPPRIPQKIKMSGGISWYPRDSIHYEQLQQYSDFAMYQVKHSTKGEISDFDIGAYHSEEYISQNRRELSELIEKEKVEYYFQPIVDAHTGEIFAYEALMRGTMPTLRRPDEILSIAKEEHKLDKIEQLTWKKASHAYMQFIRNNVISSDCKVFINSLADYKLDNQTIELIETKCRGYLDHFVFEITEDSQINKEAMEVKRVLVNRWNSDFALDDYGSGYNGERVLLELAPKYIKIDREIISGIHLNIDKQKIVENIISYAKERNIKMIAEGIETEQEMSKVIELGIDYLQGYYLARPYPEPPTLSEHAVNQIKKIREMTI